MEGWLQMPPEKNLLVRGGQWKSRYVVLSSGIPSRHAPSPGHRSTSSTTSSPVPNDGRKSQSPVHERPLHHTNSQSSSSARSSRLGPEVPQQSYLSIYKNKTDPEPLQRIPVRDISSCYVGDLGMKQKKPYIILPTLIIQLQSQDTLKDNRSFRRRSHENPYSSRSSQAAILFRPAPEAVEDLDKWRKEISSRLTPHTPTSSKTVEHSNAEPHSAGIASGFPDSPSKSPSMFLVNGEPNTALLSPSLRSKSSDLSSNFSEQKSSGSSGSDVLQTERKPRPDLQVSTQANRKFDHGPSGRPQSLPASAKRTPKTTQPEMPRETILDRFYSISGVQPDPSSPSASTFAQIHQALLEQQAGKPLISKVDDMSSKIPIQTQRALDFLSTGFMHPEDEPILSQKMKKTASSDGTVTLPGSNLGGRSISIPRSSLSEKQRTHSDDKIVLHRLSETGGTFNSNSLDPDIYSPRRASSTYSSRRNSLSSISGLSIETTSLSFTDSYHRQSSALSYQSPRTGRESISTFTTVTTNRNQESRASVSSVLDHYYRADYEAAAQAAEDETVKEEDEEDDDDQAEVEVEAEVDDDDEVFLDDDEIYLDEDLEIRPKRRTSRSGSRTKLKSLLDL
ncbi:hypothetical protein BJ508DRAFT_146689 [Ascobolus immersus RN42]|uniref:PH domain-containing protein n=1 Tax=Ascobolus immersus RN42 TaxID=1160509 RepID=A0A3N4IJ24_ASCIM|nr:hypothetical protein BJ508DRAFT_146689 [Ascobolus immersus RN42]